MPIEVQRALASHLQQLISQKARETRQDGENEAFTLYLNKAEEECERKTRNALGKRPQKGKGKKGKGKGRKEAGPNSG